jgi:hypothetical protein
MNYFYGKWKSEEAHSLWIIKIPVFGGVYAFYKPKKGRRITFLPCHYLEGPTSLYIALSIMGVMEAMLVLTPASDLRTKKEILIPLMESGSETDWMLDDMGFPWVYPLSVFQRV